jgi:hypothetical protein
MTNTQYNILVSPIVILVRVPIISILLVFMWIGEKAEHAMNYWFDWLPGFKR